MSEVFDLWKTLCPLEAFQFGLKDYAATLWIPSTENKRRALTRIKRAKRGSLPTEKKFLNFLERSLMFEEPQEPPAQIMNVFYTHLLLEGVKDKHMLSMAEQSLRVLGVQRWLCDQKWPIEIQILTVQQCNGAKFVLESIKKKCKSGETKDALTSVQKQLDKWSAGISSIKLKKGDFEEVYPILKRRGKGFRRKKAYPLLLRDLFDYKESPGKIEKLAVGWLKKEIPLLNDSVKKLAKRYNTKNSCEAVEEALDKKQKVPLSKLLSTIKSLRKKLQPIAQKEWVKITPKYKTKVIETPNYLVPFLPTAAMNTFGALTKKPYCVFYATTDKRGSPSSCVPDVVQTIVHEEYGHCVNFLNSYVGFIGMPSIVEKLESSLHTPITEGISFYREVESLRTFERINQRASTKEEKAFVKAVEKFCPFEEFVEGITFVVRKWRITRFLRALSDSRWNSGKQTVSQFVEEAHKKTGLAKKLIYDQTFFFQEFPGYAPCYSVFGERVKNLQQKAIKKGVRQRDFNTYIASIGFPARSILEKKIKQKFKL